MKTVRVLSVLIALTVLFYGTAMARSGSPIKTAKGFMEDTWGSQFLKKGPEKYFCASEKPRMKVILEAKRERQKRMMKELKKKKGRKYIKAVHYDMSQLKYRVDGEKNERAIVNVTGVIYFRDKDKIIRTFPLKRRFLLIVEKGKWKICDFQIDE